MTKEKLENQQLLENNIQLKEPNQDFAKNGKSIVEDYNTSKYQWAKSDHINGDNEQVYQKSSHTKEKVDDIDRDGQRTYQKAPKSSHMKEKLDDIYTYSGHALNQQEIFTLSCREELKFVFVAGPFGSGKTTLEVMLYYIFAEGKNEKLNFCSSYTMLGFWARARKIMCSSGESEPLVERTSTGNRDWFLHLKVQDSSGLKCNLVFADLSGEIFDDNERLKEYSGFFQDMENVLIIIDGEKIANAAQRGSVSTDTAVLLRQLLKQEIVTKTTKLQVICTKQDCIQNADNKDELEKHVKRIQNNLSELFQDKVYSIDFWAVSALMIEEDSESKKMENIICKCMENISTEYKELTLEAVLRKVRQFEYFSVRR